MKMNCSASAVLAALWCLPAAPSAWAEDLVEFLTGAKLRGEIVQIDAAGQKIKLQTVIAGQQIEREYPYARIHAVTYRGQRYVLTAKPGSTPSAAGSSKETSANPGAADGAVRRSKSEVQEWIQRVGSAEPEWYAETPLEHPESLDLEWPIEPPQKGWNSQKNVGQYLWDVVNPNPARWRSGIKLIHIIARSHADQPALLQRDMRALGEKYFNLLQDYPRAAFWLQKGKASVDQGSGIMLAECYWRLGNKAMAMEMLSRGSLQIGAIKLFGAMGETERAVQLADQAARHPQSIHQACLLAADALRRSGKYQQAIVYYEKVLAAPKARNAEYDKRYSQLAKDCITAIKLFELADVKKASDGVYRNSSEGYSGQLQVEIRVAGGQLDSVKVVQHEEKQFYASLTDTPAQILKKQSVRGIDATSGATITSQAVINATAKALAEASK